MNTGALRPRWRLNKAIARAGLSSRREADRLIADGRVRLNGHVVREFGISVDLDADVIEVGGQRVQVPGAAGREVWALYKPKRCIATLHDPQGRSSLADFLPRNAGRLFPVGRLDYDTEGLILLTNDGDLAHCVAHPSFGIDKVYLVKVRGRLRQEILPRLAEGPWLEGRHRQRVSARILHAFDDKTWLEVTLREGIQHHIKKMFAKLGLRVLKIKRYQVGSVALGELQPGESRKLGQGEIDALLNRTRRPNRRGRPHPAGS